MLKTVCTFSIVFLLMSSISSNDLTVSDTDGSDIENVKEEHTEPRREPRRSTRTTIPSFYNYKSSGSGVRKAELEYPKFQTGHGQSNRDETTRAVGNSRTTNKLSSGKTMLCKEDQYYETVLQRCRSCKIPCRVSVNVCKDMGCESYLEKLPTSTVSSFQTTSFQSAVNGRRDNGLVIPTPKVDHVEKLIVTILAPAPVTCAVTFLILMVLVVGLVLMATGHRPFPRYTYEKLSTSDICQQETKVYQCCNVPIVQKESRRSSEQLLPDTSDCKLKTAIKEGPKPHADIGDPFGYYGSAPKLL